MYINITSNIFKEIYELENNIPVFKFFAFGKWIYTENKIDVYSPINKNVIAKICLADEKLTKEIIESTKPEKIRNFPGSKRLKCFAKCVEMFEEAKEDIVNALILDAGKPYNNALGEVNATIERFEKAFEEVGVLRGDYLPGDWSEEILETEGIVKREPFGLILAISPFNYPLFISATKIIPILLSGSGFILKPSTLTPIAPLMLTRILELSGFPKEGFSTFFPDKNSLNILISHPKIKAITFTGSTETGKEILKNAGIKSFHFELGGKDPAIILKDCDLDDAVEKVVKGMVSYSGQRCDAIRLIIVEKEIYEKFKEKIVEKLKQYEPKNPLEDKKAVMGPLITEDSVKKITEIYEDALKNGAIPLLPLRKEENYVWPVLLEIDKNKVESLKAYNEDVFGPFSLLIKVDNEDEAIKISNNCRFGLDACIFGKDNSRIRKIARMLEVGAVFINEYPRHGIGYYPFGGMKDSGIGREGIGYSINTLTTTKTIIFNLKGKGIWEYI